MLAPAHLMIWSDVKERLVAGLPVRASRNRLALLGDLDDDEVLEEGVDSPAPEHPVRHVQKRMHR